MSANQLIECLKKLQDLHLPEISNRTLTVPTHYTDPDTGYDPSEFHGKPYFSTWQFGGYKLFHEIISLARIELLTDVGGIVPIKAKVLSAAGFPVMRINTKNQKGHTAIGIHTPFGILYISAVPTCNLNEPALVPVADHVAQVDADNKAEEAKVATERPFWKRMLGLQ